MENSNVIASCKKHIHQHANNCSGFVEAVANDFNIQLSGLANDIYLSLNTSVEVRKYGVGWDAARLASDDALHGKYLIIAASFAPSRGDHGHVAIVTGKS